MKLNTAEAAGEVIEKRDRGGGGGVVLFVLTSFDGEGHKMNIVMPKVGQKKGKTCFSESPCRFGNLSIDARRAGVYILCPDKILLAAHDYSCCCIPTADKKAKNT